MSTDNPRRFPRTVLVVVAVLAVLCGLGGVFSLVQGPRISDVSADPRAATTSSGARVVLTSNQALEAVSDEQVTVTPDADFTVDASGRTVGVRFTAPLHEATTYTVRVAGARGVGGGATADLTTTFTTPTQPVYLLRRSVTGDDMIYRAEIADGGARDESVIYTAPHIEDFRQTPSGLLISLVDGTGDDGVARVVVTDADGDNEREVRLPGDGFVTGLQMSDRGQLLGYQFSDVGVDGGQNRSSQLFISDLHEPDAEPAPFEVAGEAVSIDHWQFVPDSSAILAVEFSGELMLTDPRDGKTITNLGAVKSLDAITRGSYTALVDRYETYTSVDLRTGLDTVITPPQGVGTLDTVVPLADGGLLWALTQRDDAGMPTGTTLIVESAGTQRELLTVPIDDPYIDMCASPSGDRVAVTVSPGRVNDTYDLYRQPLPQQVRTYVYSVADGTRLADLAGFDISWCDAGPFSTG